ncbi:nucleotide-binding protein [Edaphobacter paludis]|uniref:Nucleotide-binding protein n=1 Tax=Edaphobacter paludis TaxID=3035702 RepID=A0AAU7DAN3_9BACT
MIERFEGASGRSNLMEALRNQKIVAGNPELAERIADTGVLIEVNQGTTIIDQGAEDNNVYLIIAGAFDIVVNGRKVARRFANDHVGEMAAIQPTQRRSATVAATEKAVLCKLTEPQLSEIARQYPDVWRFIAKELARRLEQRNAHVTATHDKIRIFIISSAEALEIARTIQNAFEYDFTVVVWTDGVFRASWYPIESLERQLDQSDFAIAVAQPDDVTHSRGQAAPTTRDNVIFELGMFIGRIGRLRSFLIEPRGEEVKLPSDLSGITALAYRYDPENLAAAMGPACNRIRAIVRELGPNN